MLDLKYVREHFDEVKEALAKKGKDYNFDKLLRLWNQFLASKMLVDSLRHDLNVVSESKDREKGRVVKEALREAEKKMNEDLHKFTDLTNQFPNIPHESVPSISEGTKTIATVGEPPKFDFKAKDHLELGEDLDIIDVQRATRMSGSRFAILKNQAVDLEFALVQWVFDKLAKKGFTKMLPPMLVREQAMWGTGFFPTEKNEVYKTDQDDLYLIGTSEVPLASYHAGEKLDAKALPLKYAGFSSCFRREAGSYGKDSYGLIRVHQFDKVEMFVYADPATSWDEFEKMADISKEIFKDLGLAYRQVAINAGELGAPNAKKYDFEIYMPHYDYRELASCSHDTDFQARRLNIKTKDGKYVHTLNNTAIAIGRTIAAILENYQQADGSVKMPEVLHKYLSFKEIRRESSHSR